MSPLSLPWRRRVCRVRRLLGSVKAWIIAVGAIAAAVGAVLVVVFLLVPGWKPCFGDTTATFEDVDARKVKALEVQVPYTVVTHGYEGKTLVIKWSLRKADSGGSFLQVPGLSGRPAATLEPSSCASNQASDDLLLPVVERGRYLVVLELFQRGNPERIEWAEKEFSV